MGITIVPFSSVVVKIKSGNVSAVALLTSQEERMSKNGVREKSREPGREKLDPNGITSPCVF